MVAQREEVVAAFPSLDAPPQIIVVSHSIFEDEVIPVVACVVVR